MTDHMSKWYFPSAGHFPPPQYPQRPPRAGGEQMCHCFVWTCGAWKWSLAGKDHRKMVSRVRDMLSYPPRTQRKRKQSHGMMLKLTPLLKYEKWTNPEGHGGNQDPRASLGSHGCSRCCSSWFSPKASCRKLSSLLRTHSAVSEQTCSPRFHAGIHRICSGMKQGGF